MPSTGPSAVTFAAIVIDRQSARKASDVISGPRSLSSD
jgi:hypothetical protein